MYLKAKTKVFIEKEDKENQLVKGLIQHGQHESSLMLNYPLIKFKPLSFSTCQSVLGRHESRMERLTFMMM